MSKKIKQKSSADSISSTRDQIDQTYSRLFKNLPGFVYKCKYDKNWTMLFMSEGCQNVTGYKPEDIINNKQLSYTDIIIPQDRKSVEKAVQKGLDEHKHFEMEYRIKTRSGEIRWVWERGFCLIDENGKPTAIEGYINDINERKIIELENLESKQMYRDLVELSPDGIIILDLKGTIINVNKSFCKLAGYPPEDFINKPIANIPTIIQGNLNLYLKLFNMVVFSNLKESIFFNFKNDKGDKRLAEARVRLIKMKGKTLVMGVLRDITDQDRTQSELINSKIKAEALLNASPDMMFVLDKHGKIIDYKSAHDKLYYQKEDLLAKNIFEILPNNVSKLTKENVAKTLSLHQIQIYNYSLDIPGKGECFYEARMVESARDEVTAIIRDVTNEKNMENNLIEAKEKAEESNNLKSAFLANMSHEIRTPLNAIVGFSSLLHRAKSGEETKKYIGLIETSSDYLLRLINDVLFYSRLETETIPINPSSVDLKGFIEKLFHTFDLVDKKKNIQLKSNISEEIDTLCIQEDYEKLWEIMTVLISNAIKYTDEGKVEFGVKKENDHLRFYVEDSGIGIPDKEIDKIFDRFHRAENVVSSTYSGTGLGLSIAQKLVNILQSELSVRSIVGKGSLFYFDIPYVPASPKVEKKSKKLTLKSTFDEFIVLIVEDNDLNFMYLNELMNDCVSRIDHAVNGKEAVDMVEKNQYDLILMDVKMPVMNGIEATKIIKKKHPSIPIILQTAFSELEENEILNETSADGSITKPIDQSNLQTVLENVCQIKVCH
jgi:PAS domain S-box-containing protein